MCNHNPEFDSFSVLEKFSDVIVRLWFFDTLKTDLSTFGRSIQPTEPVIFQMTKCELLQKSYMGEKNPFKVQDKPVDYKEYL